MKSKLTKILILAITAIMLFGTVFSSAYESYDTYTYSIDGKPLMSPAAYTPDVATYDYVYMGLDKPLNNATDIVTDSEGNFYITDVTNSRIIVLNRYNYKVKSVIEKYVDEYGREQTFNSPEGIYVTNPNKMIDGSESLFVCDTANKRIVVFDRDTTSGEFVYSRTITVADDPEGTDAADDSSPLLTKKYFMPTAIAVDIYGRIFVASRQCYRGIIVMSGEGEFTGYIGAQKITADPLTAIWENLTGTDDKSDYKLPNPFNNLTVDDLGFVYATISFTSEGDKTNQLAALQSKDSTYSPIKKLNSVGKEILNRTGFFDPGGEVGATNPIEVSMIRDVALGAEGTWSLLDQIEGNTTLDISARSRIFTYDSSGNLLFAFGDKGNQVGNASDYTAMTYQVVYDEEADKEIYNLAVLDRTSNGGVKLVIYEPTVYCDMIMEALHYENNYKYAEAIDSWQAVLTRNNNFDLAYIGIGKALFNQGKYDEAMKMLQSAYETDYYSIAFAAKRKDILSVWLLPLIIVLIVAIGFFFKFLGWAKKRNKATALKVGRKSYGEELLYVLHLIFHPFDGFWDLKHEKRGSVRAATTILGISVIAFFYQSIGQGYVFNPRGDYTTVFMQVLGILVPVLLWVVANWCLTTLFDGEGSFKDIYIATCYSLAPLPVFITISTVLTNVFTINESGLVNLLATVGWVWALLLLFFGMVVTHDYSIGKNIITTLGTIVAMAVIMFIAILFSSLVVKMVTFVISIVTEIATLV
ncbi:MAG: YIP1 family protein [Clostridia bacterium]|nr:YIP1 family protein [Clostridia bacterium]